MGHMTLISEYFYDKRDNSSILTKIEDGLEVNNYKNFSLTYAADKGENICNSAFFAFYQATICWLLITL